MRKKWIGSCGVLAACVCGAALMGRAALAEVPAGAAIEHDEGYWKGLEERLESTDAGVRSGAIKELEQVPWEGTRHLQRLLDKSGDDAVKAGLEARIEEIAEQMATDPPPISVELHDAHLPEVVRALQAATGVPMRAWPPEENQSSKVYSLKAKERFWDIFTALSAQHSLMVQRSDRLQIQEQEPGLLRSFPATSGFRIFPGVVTRSKVADLQAETGNEVGEETLSMQYTLAADPRVKIVSYSPPMMTEVTDDADNELLMAVPRSGRRYMQNAQAGQVTFESSSALQMADNMGKKIASAKGEAHFLVELSEDVLVVEKPADKLNQPLRIGGWTLSISKFDPQDQTISVGVTASAANRAGRRGGQAPIHVQVVDKGNQVVWESDVYGGINAGVGISGFKGPFHLRFSGVKKTKDLLVEFELKDLPIP